MVGSYKVDGYRVQVYAGGNSRKDRQTAEEIGAKLKRSFPTEPVYVHFLFAKMDLSYRKLSFL